MTGSKGLLCAILDVRHEPLQGVESQASVVSAIFECYGSPVG